GLSAALVLGRARRSVAVVDAGAAATLPPTFLEVGREEVTGCGVEIIDDTVTQIDPGFMAHLASGATMSARRMLVTTGVTDDLPSIAGVRERCGGYLLPKHQRVRVVVLLT
ncbi:MAG TPA: hypothetical protein VIK54_17985, partial [Acidimicrobiia bacterium]